MPLESKGFLSGLGTVSLMLSGRVVGGLIEKVERFSDEAAEVSVALGGRFEKMRDRNPCTF